MNNDIYYIKEQKDYYPFGKEHENANLMSSTNRWGYNGKEKQTIRDLGWLDFSARMYANCEMPIFTIQDPLAEKRPWESPYSFCGNNPVNRIDPNGMLDDWVRNYETDEYEWMDNVTAPENTPEGYKYIGANGNDILTDMGVTTNYDEQYKNGKGFSLVDGDMVTQYGYSQIKGTLSVEIGKTKGNISISANVSNNVENATENNHAGKTFDGISVTGNFIQPANQNQEGGNLFVAYGDKQYSSYLKYPTLGSSNIIQAGTTLKTATVNIPASEINSYKVLSGTSIKAAFANPALLWQVHKTNMNWNLQTGTSFRPFK
jgi:RHS repeat-associated protein